MYLWKFNISCISIFLFFRLSMNKHDILPERVVTFWSQFLVYHQNPPFAISRFSIFTDFEEVYKTNQYCCFSHKCTNICDGTVVKILEYHLLCYLQKKLFMPPPPHLSVFFPLEQWERGGGHGIFLPCYSCDHSVGFYSASPREGEGGAVATTL